MSFSKLPIELTQHILRLAIPDSFENAAATCKLLHMASRPLVDEYKKAKRFQNFRYSRHCSELDFSCEAASLPDGVYPNCNDPQHWDKATAVSGIKIVNAVGLLEAIARKPDIARYIESLDLKDPDRHFRQLEDRPSFTQDPQDVQNLHRLYRAAMPSDVEKGGKDFALWMKDVTPFLADVFILNLVPNVVEIALSKSWGRADIVNTANLELLDAMVRRANDPTVRAAPLARLAIVKPYVGHGWDAHACLTPLASFLALNSVREFYMGGVQAFSNGEHAISFKPRHAVYGNSLKKIQLNGSAVGPRALSALLSRTPQLECLHLELESKPSHFGSRYNIGHLLAIICSQVGGTLKELAIHANAFTTNTYTLTNMHGFTRLQVLELDIESLCGPKFSAPELVPSGRLDEYFPQFPRDADPALPRLVDLLPPSLVTLTLVFPPIPRCIPSTGNESKYVFFRSPKLLNGFRDERSTKLPCLSDIVFEPPSDMERYANNDRESEFAKAIDTVIKWVKGCGVRWGRGTPSCFQTFNDRFDVMDASKDY